MVHAFADQNVLVLDTTYIFLASEHGVIRGDRHGQRVAQASKAEHQQHCTSQESLRLRGGSSEFVHVYPEEANANGNDPSSGGREHVHDNHEHQDVVHGEERRQLQEEEVERIRKVWASEDVSTWSSTDILCQIVNTTSHEDAEVSEPLNGLHDTYKESASTICLRGDSNGC